MALTSGQLENERRKQRNQIIITDFTTCYYCKSTGLKETDKFCPNCAFPQRGTSDEMRKFMWKISGKKKLLAEQKKAIDKAKNLLFLLAGLNLLMGVVLGVVVEKNIPTLLAGILGAGIYFGLGLWSRSQPFPAILSGFFVYIVFNVIAAIVNPATIIQGILWKIIIISGFIYGYKGVKDSKTLESELEQINNSQDLSSDN